MSTVREYIASLAKKTGVKQDDEALQAILAASALNEVEMPDSLLSQLNKGIYTKEAAKNDQEIQDHYYGKIKGNIYGEIYKDMDSLLEEGLEIFGLDGEEIKEVKSKDNASLRQKELIKIASSKKGKGNIDVEKYNKEIGELNKKIKSLQETHYSELDQVKKQSRNNETDFLLKSKILSAPLIDDDKIPGGKEYLADAIIKKVRSKFHVDRDENNNLLLKDLKDPSMEAFLDNEKQEIEKVLSNELHPFIKRSDPQPGAGGAKPPKITSEEVDMNSMTVQQWIKNKKAS